MTYLTFHLVFILPPILLLAAIVRPGRRDILILGGMCVIALAYTTPWDNYLVYRSIWTYGADRVIGTIGYVPVEEYLFFILQPLLTGLTYLLLVGRLHGMGVNLRLRNPPPAHLAGAIGGLLLTAVGAAALTLESSLYLGLILVWAGPVIAGQWYLYGRAFLSRTCVVAILVPSVYLWIADRIALRRGIWSISDAHTVGIEPFGLPIEEAVFFLVTNVLVVQGIIMLRGD